MSNLFRLYKRWNLPLLLAGLFFGLYAKTHAQYTESNTFEKAETFEGQIPSTWKTNEKGTIETTTFRKKQGNKSLLWNWEAGSKLIVTDPSIAAGSYDRNFGIKLWVYSEVDIGDSIRIAFYNGSNQVDCSFYFKINFKGWRGMWVRFEDDMGRSGHSTKLTHMEITSPESVSSGRLFFDIFEISLISYKRSPSHQFAAPHVTSNSFFVEDEEQSYVYEKWFPEAALPSPSQVTPEEQNDLEIISERLENWLFGTEAYSNDPSYQARVTAMNKFISNGIANFNKQNIVRAADGRIIGPGLFTVSSDHSPKFGMDFAQNLMIPLALDFRLNKIQASKEKLFLLFDYFHDQGWAAGSALETLDHQKLRMVGWIYAVYLLRDELKKEPWEDGKTMFDREMETMKWMTAFNTIFAPADFLTEINVDDWRSTTLFRLLLILMLDESDPRKTQYMRYYQQWLDRNLAITYGWNDGIKPDGLGYHHRGPYLNAYSNNGVHIMAQIAYFLRHTVFDMSRQSKENMKYYLMNYRLMTHLYDVPKGISGRFTGYDSGASIIAPMAYMAKSMDPDKADTTLARAMMRLWNPTHEPVRKEIESSGSSIMYLNTPGEMEAILNVAGEGFTPEPSPTGFWSKPYAAMALFRGENWMVTVKGTNSYVWDYESASGENEYGRFDSHGQMEIVNNQLPYPASWKSGHDVDHGWRWGKVPGTTSVDYANTELPRNIHRIYSPNTTAGAVMHRQKSGVWAMEYEDKTYGSGLKFKKSVFFFGGNQMVCLGSDITSAEPSGTVSTICQHVISSSKASFTVNGAFTPANSRYRPDSNDRIIMNSLGQGIYVPDASNLEIWRTQQNSITTIGGKSSYGDVFTAWFDNSSRSDYEYVVVMDADESIMQQLRDKSNYEIVEQSSKAHIVRYLPDSITGYAIFDPAAILQNSRIIRSTRPVFALMEKTGSDAFILSICDPDFNRPVLGKTFASLQGPYDPTTIDITFSGLWQMDEAYDFASLISASDEQTVIRFTCFDAESNEIHLKHTPLTKIETVAYPKINVFPNPGSGQYKLSSKISGTVFDIYGKKVLTVENRDSLNLADHPSGIYFLKWRTSRGYGTIRLMNQTIGKSF